MLGLKGDNAERMVGLYLSGDLSLTRSDPMTSEKAAVRTKSEVQTQHFPTDARKRQKAMAKTGHVAKKRPQSVEQHIDDCGEDDDSQESSFTDYNPSDKVVQHYYNVAQRNAAAGAVPPKYGAYNYGDHPGSYQPASYSNYDRGQ